MDRTANSENRWRSLQKWDEFKVAGADHLETSSDLVLSGFGKIDVVNADETHINLNIENGCTRKGRFYIDYLAFQVE